MTLFLHIGTHKTGTTAIQRFAAKHHDTLRRRGLWYPLYQDFGLKSHYAHHALAHALAGTDAEQLAAAKTFATGIGREPRPANTLISAEPIYRHVYPRGGEDYWAGRRAYVERLRGLFPGDDVEVILVVRRRDAFAKSLYQERIKVTRYAKPFSEFVDSEPHQFEYHRQLELFTAHFPRARVLLYEELAKGNLIDAFFSALGLDVGDLEHEPQRNVGWPVPVVEFKRLLNSSRLSDAEVRRLQSVLEKADLTGIANAEWWTHEAASQFVERFAHDDALLAEHFFPGRGTPLFRPSEPSSTRLFGGLTPDEIAELSAILFRAKPEAEQPGLRTRLSRVWNRLLRGRR